MDVGGSRAAHHRVLHLEGTSETNSRFDQSVLEAGLRREAASFAVAKLAASAFASGAVAALAATRFRDCRSLFFLAGPAGTPIGDRT